MPTRIPTVDSASPDLTGGPDLTRYVLVCLGLVALVLFLAWFFRRFVAESIKRRAAKRSLRVVDVLPLGGKRRLAVVHCYDRCFLIGLGEKEITSIAELDTEDASTFLGGETDAVASVEKGSHEPEIVVPPIHFAESLRDAMRRPNPPHRPRGSAGTGWKQGEGVLG